MSEKAFDAAIRFDLRARRAHELAAYVMNIVGKYIDNHEENFPKRASRDLTQAFYDAGVEVITDAMRAQYGLPPRGPDGLTAEEAYIMESSRKAAMLAPFPPLLLAKSVTEAAAPELLAALIGVVKVADRKTVEFDAARAAIAKATTP